jgi:hypothetical protein
MFKSICTRVSIFRKIYLIYRNIYQIYRKFFFRIFRKMALKSVGYIPQGTPVLAEASLPDASQTNKQTNKQANKQTNKQQTNKQTNKQTNNSYLDFPI